MKVAEMFVSIQGEGASAGLPTCFIRLQGCNLSCSWCDTAYANPARGGRELSPEEVVRWAVASPFRRVCVTGGEPLLQKGVAGLITMLTGEGFSVEVETNGSVDIFPVLLPNVTVNMDYKLPSSGMEGEMLPGNLALLRDADQLKFVVAGREDFRRALEVLDIHKPRSRVAMTSVGGTELTDLAKMVLDSGRDIRVYPQLHKLLWGNRKGV